MTLEKSINFIILYTKTVLICSKPDMRRVVHEGCLLLGGRVTFLPSHSNV